MTEFRVDKDFNFYNQEVEMALRDGDFNLAKNICQDILQKNNNDVNALVDLGNIYASGGQSLTAKSYYEKALALDDKCHRAMHNLSIWYLRTGNTEKALCYNENALMNSPGDYLYLNTKAICLLKMGDSTKAIDCYNQALKVNPKGYFAKYSLAYLYKEQQDWNASFRESIELWDLVECVTAYYEYRIPVLKLLAFLAEKKNNFALKLDYLNKLCVLNPEDEAVYFEMARCYYNLDLYDEALDYFEKAIYMSDYKRPREDIVRAIIWLCEKLDDIDRLNKFKKLFDLRE